MVSAFNALKDIADFVCYPKEESAVRDLLRNLCQLVLQNPANILSLQNILARYIIQSLSSYNIKKFDNEQAGKLIKD